MTLLSEDIVKLLLAILVGGLIGAEREYRDRAAGFRTIIFICVGATLFTNFSIKLSADSDPTRIAANIVSGVGFLGAGAIMRGTGEVVGLTTASTIWLTAALGMGIGGGEYALALIGVVAILIVLWVFPKIEKWIDDIRDTHIHYEVILSTGEGKFGAIEDVFVQSGMRVQRTKQTRSGEDMICQWSVYGKPEAHLQLMEKLLVHPDVKQFHV
jgi:putative Mg2+ transporter-C (MgtC) family protein